MKFKHLFSLAFFFFGLCELSLLPAQARAPIAFPVTYSGGHLFVDLDSDFGKLHLLLDTGWDRSAISSQVVNTAGSIPVTKGRTISLQGYGSNSVAQAYRSITASLRVGQAEIYSGTMDAMSMDPPSKALNEHVDGVLGWDFFEQRCVRLDYGNQTITVAEPSQCSSLPHSHATADGHWTAEGMVIPGHIDFANGRCATAMLRLDTGSDASIFLRSEYRRIAGLEPNPTDKSGHYGEGTNGPYQSDLVRTKRVRLGDGWLTFSDGAILIGRPGSRLNNIGLSQLLKRRRSVDGEIGNAILERLIVTFDPFARKVYLEPTDRTVKK